MALHTYTPTEWKNAPDHKTTPMNATNLNHIEEGIENAYADISTLNNRNNSIEGIISLVETDLTSAAHSYSAGSEFIYNDTLYVATQAISVGSAIVIDGNCQAQSQRITHQLENIRANNLENSVDISSARESNPYYAPSDGYLNIANTGGLATIAFIRGADASGTAIAIGGVTGYFAIFVRKGMRIFFNSTGSCSFIALKQ